jgi:endonuclease/exonuclease/phosphatase family metal-dependent hydrolase
MFELKDTFSARLLMKTSQVVVAARFQHISSGKEMVVVSLHLKSGYKDDEPTRREQFIAAMDKVTEKWNDMTHLSVIVAGDLNSDITQSFGKLVQSLVGEEKVRLCEGFGFRNAADTTNREEKNENDEKEAKAGRVVMTARTPTYIVNYDYQSVFDYIFVGKHVPRILSMSTQRIIPDQLAPNASQGSDHFPVTATLGL